MEENKQYLVKSNKYSNSFCEKNNFGVYSSYAGNGVWREIPKYVSKSDNTIIDSTENEFYITLSTEKNKILKEVNSLKSKIIYYKSIVDKIDCCFKELKMI